MLKEFRQELHMMVNVIHFLTKITLPIIYVKNREFIPKEGDKTGYGTENGNTDAITETYTIVHKDQLANYGKENRAY